MTTSAMTMAEAALLLLTEESKAGRPSLHYRDITSTCIARGWIKTSGKTPAQTMRVVLSNSVLFVAEGDGFYKLADGTEPPKPAKRRMTTTTTKPLPPVEGSWAPSITSYCRGFGWAITYLRPLRRKGTRSAVPYAKYMVGDKNAALSAAAAHAARLGLNGTMYLLHGDKVIAKEVI